MDDHYPVQENGDSSADEFVAARPPAWEGTMTRSDSESEFLCSCCYGLMVQPTTLVCGHSFCRLCLAMWFQASKKKECPTCRQVWHGHPQVNVSLRNMMDKLLGERIKERELELLRNGDSVEKLLEFDRLLREESKKPKADVGAFCVGILITLGVILIAYLVWYWRHTDDNLLVSKPVLRWKPADVERWLTDMGWAEEYIDIVHMRGIDGSVLLSLEEIDIAEVFNISNPLHERALILAINDIRDFGVKLPGNIWEFKALYPGMCIFLLYGLVDYPRITLLYLYLFHYEEVYLPFLHLTTPDQSDSILFSWTQLPSPTVHQLIVFITNAAILPFWLIAKCTWSVFMRQFWTSSVVMLTCLLQSLAEAVTLKTFIMERRWRFPVAIVKGYGKGILTIMIVALIWPVIPKLVSDFFFYTTMYFYPLQKVKGFYQSLRRNVL